jgi:hypothetical protein
MNNDEYLSALRFCVGPEDPTVKFIAEETVASSVDFDDIEQRLADHLRPLMQGNYKNHGSTTGGNLD